MKIYLLINEFTRLMAQHWSVLATTAILLVFGFLNERRFESFRFGGSAFIYLYHLQGDVCEKLVDVFGSFGGSLDELNTIFISLNRLKKLPRAWPYWKVTALLEPISTLFPTSMQATFWLTLLRIILKFTCSFRCTSGRCFRNFSGLWCRKRWWSRVHLYSNCSWSCGSVIGLQCPTRNKRKGTSTSLHFYPFTSMYLTFLNKEKRYEVDSDCVEEVLVELVLLRYEKLSYRKSGEDAWLSDTAVADEQDFQIMITGDKKKSYYSLLFIRNQWFFFNAKLL